MSFNQARQLAEVSPGLTVGSHAHTHRQLASLDDDSQRYELAESRRILETQVGQEVRCLPILLVGLERTLLGQFHSPPKLATRLRSHPAGR